MDPDLVFSRFANRDGHPMGGITPDTNAGRSLQTLQTLQTMPNEQLASPLFGRLPPELRAMIFTEVFGNRRVHLAFIPHPLLADKVGHRRRWRHGLCEDELATPFGRVIAHPHYCLIATRRKVLDISMLFTCRRALIESIPILYQRNVFLIVNTGSRRLPVDDIRSLQAKMPKHWPLIQSLEVKWEVAPSVRNEASMVPHFGGRDAYEAFWDALAEMPALSRLRVALLMPRCPQADLNPPAFELRDFYLGPIGRLKSLRLCQVAMPKSYLPLFGEEECRSFTTRADGAQYHFTWVDDDSGRVPFGPAMANISHLIPRGLM